MSEHAEQFILVAEDEPTTAIQLKRILEKADFNVLSARDGNEAVRLMSSEVALVCLDLHMPGTSGFDCIKFMQREYPKTPIVVVSAGDTNDAVKAMKRGAYWFLQKPVAADQLLGIVNEALQHFKERPKLDENFILFLGESATSKEFADSVSKLLTVEGPVLLVGESGTGKSHLARYIHSHGPESEGPFISVPCSSINADSFDEFLFGTPQGPGKLESAAGGTLLLEDVCALPLELQAKFASFMENSNFQRIGETEERHVEVRVIATTTKNLDQFVSEKLFLADLLYRVKRLTLQLPALRERIVDLPEITRYLLNRIGERRGGKSLNITDDALRALTRYDWPGNLRELENVLEHASAFSNDDTIHLANLVMEHSPALNPEDSSRLLLGGLPLEEIERRAIIETLRLVNGNKAAAARNLGISERSIYNKIKRFGLSDIV
ncbi:MAG: sigma-54-dependent Fis family transcriptional regulator [Bdellovibrionales bacterium]|nr:sigma-54-dependent Fis family transcriptional regulator [Bdellovibrionales bacterium]